MQHRRFFGLALVLVAALAACSSDSPTRPPQAQVLRLADDGGTAWTAEIADPVVLARARSLAGSAQQHWFYGTIRRGSGGHNGPWSWHLEPATVDFAEVTVEACQSTVRLVEGDLDYWLGYGTVCILSRVTS